MERLFLCKHCKKPLEYADTLDTEGSIDDGYIQEHQMWTCDHCDVTYVIDLWAKITNSEVTYFEEG